MRHIILLEKLFGVVLMSLFILRFAYEFLDINISYHPQDVSRAANLLLVRVMSPYYSRYFWSNITELAFAYFRNFLTSCLCDS